LLDASHIDLLYPVYGVAAVKGVEVEVELELQNTIPLPLAHLAYASEHRPDLPVCARDAACYQN
jgi:hypothetical protein